MPTVGSQGLTKPVLSRKIRAKLGVKIRKADINYLQLFDSIQKRHILHAQIYFITTLLLLTNYNEVKLSTIMDVLSTIFEGSTCFLDNPLSQKIL